MRSGAARKPDLVDCRTGRRGAGTVTINPGRVVANAFVIEPLEAQEEGSQAIPATAPCSLQGEAPPPQ